MQALHEHLRGHLGNTDREVCSGAISVLAWPDPDGNPDISILVTLGMSLIPQVQPPPGKCVVTDPRTELMVVSPKAHEDAVARSLIALAHYPAREHTWLHWFHNVTLGGPLVPGSPLTAVLTDVPFVGASFSTLELPTGRIDILWVIPITAPEQVYLQAHGFDAFSELFEASEPVLHDLFRESVIAASGA